MPPTSQPAPRERLGAWASALLDLVFPPRCAGCRRPGVRLCAACRAAVRRPADPLCPLCGLTLPRRAAAARAGEPACPACRRAPLALDGIRSAAAFSGPLRPAVHQLKYRGRRDLAPLLATFLLETWERAPLPADLVVPVPLHAARRATRGYNQAALLGQAFARGAGLDFAEDGLARTRATAPQVELKAGARRANVQAAFEALPARVAGRQVLVVDDVCTTGATLGACGQALRAAGSRSVWALTLARALWDVEQDAVDDVC